MILLTYEIGYGSLPILDISPIGCILSSSNVLGYKIARKIHAYKFQQR